MAEYPDRVGEPVSSPTASRRHLVERIASSSDRVVVISGPAGSGKTMLARAACSGSGWSAFLPLTRHHNTSRALLAGLLSSLEVVERPEDPDDVTSWLHLATSAMKSRAASTGSCHLVIDGADALTDAAAQEIIRDLIELIPGTARLTITTRHRGPTWISKARACGTASLIDADDLRWTSADSRQVSNEDLLELDGWALGVTAVASMGRRQSRSVIRDYLRNEVVNKVTTEVRHLLTAVSIVSEATPALAIELSGNAAAGQLLSQFASATQFVTIEPGPVFRLHPVLIDCLTDELKTEHWAKYKALSRRYAAWLSARGRIDQSVRVLLDLQDVDFAKQAVLEHWQQYVPAGQPSVIRRAIDHLPHEVVESDSRLCLAMAMTALAVGDHTRWFRWAEIAFTHPDERLESGITVHEAVGVSRRLALSVVGCPASDQPPQSLTGLWSALAKVADGLSACWAGNVEEALVQLHAAEVTARVCGDRLALVHALGGVALASAMLGDVTAVHVADEAIANADRLSDECRWVSATAYLALALTHEQAGNSSGARDAARETLHILERFPRQVEQRARDLALSLLRDSPTSAMRHVETSRDLTGRELRVLRALSGPLSMREIADELYVSYNTVKTQVASIFRKLDVHDRAAAVTAARTAELVKW